MQALSSASISKVAGPKSQGQAVVAEFQAISGQIAKGKTDFTLTTNGVTKTYHVASHGDVSQFRKNVYKDIVVKEDQAGQKEATTHFQMGSADGIDNMLFYKQTPDSGQPLKLAMTYPSGFVMPNGNNGDPE